MNAGTVASVTIRAHAGSSLVITQPIIDNGSIYGVNKVGAGVIRFNGKTGAITNADETGGVNPIVITTAVPHGLATDDQAPTSPPPAPAS